MFKNMMCISEFGLPASIVYAEILMVGDSNNPRDEEQFTEIDPLSFNNYLENIYQSNNIINFGIPPQTVPDIIITSKFGRNIEFTTSQMQLDSGHYQYEYTLLEEKIIQVIIKPCITDEKITKENLNITYDVSLVEID